MRFRYIQFWLCFAYLRLVRGNASVLFARTSTVPVDVDAEHGKRVSNGQD